MWIYTTYFMFYVLYLFHAKQLCAYETRMDQNACILLTHPNVVNGNIGQISGHYVTTRIAGAYFVENIRRVNQNT